MSLEEQNMHERLPPELDQKCPGVSESMFFPFPLTDGKTMIQWSTEYLAPTRDEAKFLAFLSLYGSNGVPLRDLITFATLRTSCKSSENHWLLNGEAGPILRPVGDSSLPNHCAFLNAFVRTCFEDQSLENLQYRLLYLGLIEIKYLVRRSDATSNFWRSDELNDERIWCAAKNPMSSHLMVPTWQDQDGEGIVMDLLYVFLEMPSKDVSLLAERHRETFYIHARIFALETLRFCQSILKNARDYVVALILELLTHRSQNGDNRLIQLAKSCPSSANGLDWAIMVLWAELKELNSGGGSRVGNALNKSITRLLSWRGKRQRRANGFIGYLLVEWKKAAEVSQDGELNSQIVKYAMEWVETAWSSGSSIECAALCCVLANFRMLDKGVLVSPRYRLLYGYHLSRAGHLEQAKEFLALALHSYTASELSTRLLGYRFELVSVLVRLGNRQQAKRLLQIIEDNVNISPRMEGRRKSISRDRQYEYEMLSELYQAELLMPTGDVSLSAFRLTNTMRTGSRQDCYFWSLRLACEVRLLEVQTRGVSPERALNVAEALIVEIRDKSSLDPDLMQWIIQQLLTLSNRLLWTGNVSAASSLLDKIVDICHYQHCSHSVKDLLPYIKQRRATVSNMLSADHAENDPTTVDDESKAASNESLDVLDRPSNEQTYPPKKTVTDSADIITRPPHNNAEAAAISALLSDPWGPVPRTPSSTLNEPMTLPPRNITTSTNGTIFTLSRLGPEEPEPSHHTMNEPSEKASSTKPTASTKSSRSGGFNKKLVQRGLPRSVVAMLRRAPRAPTSKPGISVIESREKEPAPIPMDPPLAAELTEA